MKILSSLLFVTVILSTSWIGSASAKDYDFECKCAKGACENLESLFVMYTSGKIQVSVGTEDGEFNTSFNVEASKKKVPENYSQYKRFSPTNRDYLPAIFDKGELLIKSDMKNGGTRIGGIRKIKYVGSVIVLDSKGKEKIFYGCERF